MHPYSSFKKKYLGLSSLGLLSQVWLLFLPFHLAYIILNLSAVLNLTTERWFLLGYPTILVFGLVYWSKKILPLIQNKNQEFDLLLENKFKANFKWINLINHYSSNDKRNSNRLNGKSVPVTLSEEILSPIWSKENGAKAFLWKKYQLTFYSAIISGALMLGFHLQLYAPIYTFFRLPNLSEEWTSNLQAVLHYTPPQYELTYPKMVKQGDNFTLTYQGDYNDNLITIQDPTSINQSSYSFSNQGNLTLSNIQTPLHLNYRFKKGRITLNNKETIKLLLPPSIENLTLKITSHEGNATYEGIYLLEGIVGSVIKGTIYYQSDQEIKLANIYQSNQASTNLTRITLDDVAKNQVHFTTILNRPQQFQISVENSHEQSNLSTLFKFSLKQNHPPTVNITSPQDNISMVKPNTLTVGWIAEDDYLLNAVNLHWRLYRGKKIIAKQSTRQLIASKKAILTGTSLIDLPSIFKQANLTSSSINKIKFEYYVEAKDNQQLKSYSQTNLVTFFTTEKTYQQKELKSDALQQKISEKKEVFDNLQNEFSELEILAEQKSLDKDSLKSFQENLDEVYKDLHENITQIEELDAEQKASNNPSSLNLQKKLQELKQALESIDKNFIKKLQEKSSQLLQELNQNQLSEKDLKEFFDSVSSEKISRDVDQMITAAKRWRRLQKIDSLEKLAQNLYTRYKDLEVYLIAKIAGADEAKIEGEEIANQLNFIKSEFKIVKKDFQEEIEENPADNSLQDQTIQTLFKKIDTGLAPKEIKAIRELKNHFHDAIYLIGRSSHLDHLRKNFYSLNNLNQDIDGKALLKEINQQIVALSDRISWINQLLLGERYDLNYLSEEKKRQLITLLISKQQSMLSQFKESLFLLSSPILLQLDFLDYYDFNFEAINKIKKEIDPAAHLGTQKKIEVSRHSERIKHLAGELVSQLIQLKEWVKNLKARNQSDRSLESALEQQQKLNQRISQLMQKQQQGGLSPQEKKLLQQMALEQSYIQSLMEQARQSQQNANDIQNNGSSGTSKNGNKFDRFRKGSQRGKNQQSGTQGGGDTGNPNGNNPNANKKESKEITKETLAETEARKQADIKKNQQVEKERQKAYQDRLKSLIGKMNQLASEMENGNSEKIEPLREEIEKELKLTEQKLKSEDQENDLSSRKAEQAKQYQQEKVTLDNKKKDFLKKLSKVKIQSIKNEYRERVKSFFQSIINQ